jgi:hypothetical protein
MIAISGLTAIFAVPLIICVCPIALSCASIGKCNKFPACGYIIQCTCTITAIILAAVYMYILYGYYVPEFNKVNDAIRAEITNCTVIRVVVEELIIEERYKFIAWYQKNNITNYISGGCALITTCWPTVGGVINCWPVRSSDASTIVDYSPTPVLMNFSYINRHITWGIVQCAGVLIVVVLSVIIMLHG